jgi:hypothetical protein
LVVTAATWSSGSAQTVAVAAARWFSDPHVSDYRVSITSYHLGPLALRPFGQLALQGPRQGGAALLGGGADLTVNLTRSAQPFLVTSLSGGVFDFRRGLGIRTWHAWSAGGGFELGRLAGIGLAVEARLQGLSRGGSGVSLGIRLGSALGTDRSPGSSSAPVDRPSRSPVDPPPGEARPSTALATARGVGEARLAVDAAFGAMGTPYRWGGTDANGFDCSGLIWFAYQRAGVQLPRRSVEQANAGRSVGVAVPDLVAGDILVFSREPGGAVSHVGLYIGDGRFIHSASTGTKVSRLAGDDPAGGWWFERWIDARRVID